MEPIEIDDYLLNPSLRQYVMFTGLDLTNNPHHASIHAAFVDETRVGALAMSYGFLTHDHELFRRPSSAASSFGTSDAAQPHGRNSIAPALRKVGGIIKRAWSLKYLRQRAALIVCFVDVDWDETNWLEKKTECESKINSLRQSLGHRDTRIALVLVPRIAVGVTSPPHNIVAEKKLELCGQCKLPPKNVFVLPCVNISARSDASSASASESPVVEDVVTATTNSAPLLLSRSFLEAITRCEVIFHELAQDAYMHFLKRIRARSIPNNDARLLIRQQYKLAFISELREDVHSALRYYKTAYQNIVELDVNTLGDGIAGSVDMFEVHSVAGLLNFKVCEICFVLNSANDAILHFHRHQKAFFQRSAGTVPSIELALIEFAWWKSQQCRLFGELFERAVSSGLAAYAFQNPGRFFDESALAYKNANALIRQLRERVAASARSSPAAGTNDSLKLTDFNRTTFYGQRPWRDVESSSNSPVASQLNEHAAKVALEQTVRENYQRSLQLWSSAVIEFKRKRYSCEGSQNAALIHMADDYVQLHKLGTSLQLLHRVTTELYARNLRHILHNVLIKYFRIAYCTVNLNEYIWALVQLLNPTLIYNDSSLNDLNENNETESDTHQEAFEENVREFLSRQFSIPPLTPDYIDDMYITSAMFSLAATQWQQYYNHSAQVSFSVEMSRVDAFLQCRARFLYPANEQFFNGNILHIEVQIRNISNLAITIDKCTLTLDEICTPNGKTNTILLEGINSVTPNGQFVLLGKRNTITFRFAYGPRIEGLGVKKKQVLIRKVSLRTFAGNENLKANASFDFDMSSANHNSIMHLDKWVSRWNTMPQKISVIPHIRRLQLNILCEPIRLLIDEAVDVTFFLKNEENVPLKRIKIIGHQIYREEASPDDVFVPVHIHEYSEPLNPKQIIEFIVRLSSKSKNCIGVQIQVSSQVDNLDCDKSSHSAANSIESVEVLKRFRVDCTNSFNVSTSITASNGHKNVPFAVGQCVIISTLVDIKESIFIDSVEWSLNKNLIIMDDNPCNTNHQYQCGDKIVKEASVKILHNLLDNKLPIGDIVIKWKSLNSCELVRNVVSLGQMEVVSKAFVVEAQIITNENTLDSKKLALEANSQQITCATPRKSLSVIFRQPFFIVYRLISTTDVVLPLFISLEHSDAFIFAGLTECVFQLMPSEVYDIRILVIAIAVGEFPFPRLLIRDAGEKSNVYSMDNFLPIILHVLP